MLNDPDWDVILVEWIAEAEEVKDHDRANSMRIQYSMLKQIEGEKRWQAKSN